MSDDLPRSEDRWFDDDEFWNAVEPVLFGPVRSDAARLEVAQMVEALDLEPPARILDVFCGPGRHLVPLWELGFAVIGVDRTSRFLSAARTALDAASGGSAGPRSATTLMLDIGGSGQFPVNTTPVEIADVALWLGASAGYDGTTGDARTLSWIRNHVRDGAVLLIEGPVAEDLSVAPLAPWEWFDEPAGRGDEVAAVWRLEHRHTRDGWLSGRWTRYELGACQRHRFRYQVHSVATWTELLANAGFTLIQHTYNLGTLDGEAERDGTRPTRGQEHDEGHARSWMLARADSWSAP